MRVSFCILLFCLGYMTSRGQDVREPDVTAIPDVADTDSPEGTSRYSGAVTMEGIVTSDKKVPFWMRANQYGSIPLAGLSTSLLAGFSRKHHEERRLLDWGFSLQGRMNVSSRTSQFQIIEAAIDARFSIFELKAGRSKDMMGLVDSTMSTGAFSVSGNAPGIPKVALSIPEFWSLPLTKGLLSVKGNFAFGYVGIQKAAIAPPPYVDVHTIYHQKSFYGRLGKENWRVKLYAGFNHQVFWGDEKKYIRGWKLSFTDAAWDAISGKTYKGSKVGNHLGSIDQAIEVELNKIRVRAYHQFFYDVGGLYHLNNIKDGLWGLAIIHKQATYHRFRWQKILIEILNSKSQGGEADAKITPSGDENYYNGTYKEGWTYFGENLGNPLLTNRNYSRAGLPSRDYLFIINNRVTALHAGLEFGFDQWSAKLLLTGSSNLGTWATSSIGASIGKYRSPGPPPYFEDVFQFSGYLEAGRPIGNGFHLGFALAVDQGKLLYNSVGGLVKLSRNL